MSANGLTTVILAGGFGTRLAEETDLIPKPMVRIGNLPIILHIIGIYASFGVSNFLICGGYRVEAITNYFLGEGQSILKKNGWAVQVIDTGLLASTASRVLQARNYVGDNFFLTYGDGLSDVNIQDLYDVHRKSNGVATVTAVRPPARFGTLEIDKDVVLEFQEKNSSKVGWINGGFFVLSKKIFDYISEDDESFESSPMKRLVTNRKLIAHKHEGFWQPMDTLREKRELEAFWQRKDVPWPGSHFLS